MENKTRKAVLILMFCAAPFWNLSFPGMAAAAAGFGQMIHKKNSLYHRILVYQYGPVVTLRFGMQPRVQVQSQVNVNNLRQHMVEYSKLAFCGLLYKPEPKKILVLGLGGGVIPREMHYYFPAADIDVVEIDPDIPPIATRFFGFRRDDNLKVHIADGRMFIKKLIRTNPVPKYDLVILDAFNSDYIPFHLMTTEFLEQLKTVLAEDGVAVANVFYTNRLFDAEFKTFLAVFGRCQAFLGTSSENAMLAAPGPAAPTLTVETAVVRAKTLQQKHRFAFNLIMVARQLLPDKHPGAHAKVLTDDRAPVNWLRNRKTNK